VQVVAAKAVPRSGGILYTNHSLVAAPPNWAGGLTHDQSRLHAMLFALSMRIALEMLERIE